MNLVGIKALKAAKDRINLKNKNKVLNDYAKLISKEKNSIINQNLKDIKFAQKKGLKENLINRLRLDQKKLENIKNSIIKIIKLKDPVNKVLNKWKQPNGLSISRVSIPIGVIGVIY